MFQSTNRLILKAAICLLGLSCEVAVGQSLPVLARSAPRTIDTSYCQALLDSGDFYFSRNSDSAKYYYWHVRSITSSVQHDISPPLVRLQAMALNGLGHVHESTSRPDSALLLFRKAGKLAEEIRDTLLLSSSLNYQGKLYYGTGQLDSADHYWSLAVRLRRRLGDNQLLANTLNNLAWLNRERGDIAMTITLLTEAIGLWEAAMDSSGLAFGMHALGSLYYQLGQYSQSLRHHMRSLSIREAIGDKRGMSASHNEIALIMKDAADWDRALLHFQRSNELCHELNDASRLGILYNNIADIYEKKRLYVEAMDYLMKAEQLCLEADHRKGIALSRMNRAQVEMKLGNVNDAMRLIRESLALYRSIKDQHGIARCLAGLGSMLMSAQELSEGHSALLESVNIARRLGSKRVEADALATLHVYYRTAGSHQKAYSTAARLSVLHDSLVIREAAAAVVRFDLLREQRSTSLRDSLMRAGNAQIANAELKLSNEVADERNEQSRAVAFSVLAALLFAGVLGGVGVGRSRIAQTRKRNAMVARVWRSQVNPNFIHTALQNINAYVQANERDLASSFLTRFARLMRAVLENARQEEVSLAADLDVMRDYLELERLRLAGRFTYSLEVDPAIDPEVVMVPPMLLQPYAEQAIWGRANQQEDCVRLVIRVQHRKDSLVLTLENDLEPNAPQRPGGSMRSEGTDITEARLTLLAKKGGRQASVKVMPLPGGHCVELTLPYNMAA